MSLSDQTIEYEVSVYDLSVDIKIGTEEIPIFLKDESIVPVYFDPVLDDVVLFIDLDNLAPSAKISKTLYGRIAALIQNVITTAGIRIGALRAYGDGLYSDSTYGDGSYINTVYGAVSLALFESATISGKRSTRSSIAAPFVIHITTDSASSGGEFDLYTYGAGRYGADVYNIGDTYGPITQQGATSLSITFAAVVAGELYTPPPKQTSVAEISLASHGIPASRTEHSIKIRGRIVTGSGGVIKAALYEGTINRSGDLTSDVLTNSFVNYSLPISNDAAAAITSYSNLSIKIWGYDPTGEGLTFEISHLYLELPLA